MVRITSLAEPPERGGAEYVHGLRAAVGAAVSYTIDGLAKGEQEGTPIPEPLLVQARRAATSGVGLDTVLRRYVAGHALLGDFLVQEAEGGIEPAELKLLLRRLSSTLDCLLAAVTAAYGLEERRHRRTAEQRRTELVERLLAGEPVDASQLGYELEAHHVGLVVPGSQTVEALNSLARALDARLLAVPCEEELTWAWLGRREPLDPAQVCQSAATWFPGTSMAVGEPGRGLSGWRLSHRQARAAIPLARNGPNLPVRYSDVALLATVVQDDLLVTSLRRFYLEPLEVGRDGGVTLRETLRAYFAADRNVSSTAAGLGVDRRTVSNRLRVVEERIGCAIDGCVSELELALQLDWLDLSRHI
jgi:diguanylate cyclase with GGDEF domain/PucR-like helix-turn-helix protein